MKDSLAKNVLFYSVINLKIPEQNAYNYLVLSSARYSAQKQLWHIKPPGNKKTGRTLPHNKERK